MDPAETIPAAACLARRVPQGMELVICRLVTAGAALFDRAAGFGREPSFFWLLTNRQGNSIVFNTHQVIYIKILHDAEIPFEKTAGTHNHFLLFIRLSRCRT